MEKRNIIFYYCNAINPDLEIPMAEKECIYPDRTKEWKTLLGLRSQFKDTYKVIGWKVAVPELDENILAIKDEVEQIKRKYAGKDEGTCVSGMFLAYKKRKVAGQISQGNTTTERFLAEVRAMLIEKFGFDQTKFVINHGNMD